MSETNTGWRLLLLDAPAPSLAVELNPITLELVSPGPQGPSGAAVTSVNGETGAVVLDASDVGAAATSHTHTASQISDSSVVGRSVLTAADASAARSALSAAASSHTHAIADVSGLQTALDLKAATSHTHGVGDVTGLGTAATRNAPAAGNAGAAEVVLGSDSRLSDTRTPTDGSVTSAKIPSQAVTYAKIQNVTANRLLGRTIGSGSVEELQVTSPLAIDSATGALKLNNNATNNNAVMFYSGGLFSTSNRFGWNNSTATLTISDTAGADASSFTNTGISTVVGGAFFVDIKGGILTLGDISNNETRIVIDDASSDISIFANTLSASSTAATFASLSILGTLSLANGEFLSNSSNGQVEIGPNGTTTSDYSMVVDGTSWGFGVKLSTKNRNTGGTNAAFWFASSPMTGYGVPFQLGTDSAFPLQAFDTGSLRGVELGLRRTGIYNGAFAIMDDSAVGSANRRPAAAPSNPWFYAYAGGTANAGDFVRVGHNGTKGIVEAGSGDLDLMTPAGSSVKANGSTLATQAFAIIQAVALS